MDRLENSDELSSAAMKLMSDDSFGELLSSVRSAISANAENYSPTDTSPVGSEAESAAQNAASGTASPISAIPQISPELLSKLPEIMSALSAGTSGGDERKGASRMADRKRLLTAMKPFLSENRRNAVDSIVNIAGIADLFGI